MKLEIRTNRQEIDEMLLFSNVFFSFCFLTPKKENLHILISFLFCCFWGGGVLAPSISFYLHLQLKQTDRFPTMKDEGTKTRKRKKDAELSSTRLKEKKSLCNKQSLQFVINSKFNFRETCVSSNRCIFGI